jgi:hypothetical protein
MLMADSILGKRVAEDGEVQGGKLDLSLGLNYDDLAGATQKCGRKGAEHQGSRKEMLKDSVAGRTRRRIATGHKGAENLTRPNGASRQEQ